MTDRSFTLDGIAVMPFHRIGGHWIDGPALFDLISPIDERTLGALVEGTPDEALQAVQAAQAAFPAWSGAGAARRAQALRWLADEMDARREAFALVECLNTGALLADLRGPQGVAAWTDALRLAAEQAIELEHLTPQLHYRPAGVCAVLLPAYGALAAALWHLAGALAAGNTVVVMTAEQAPLAGALLADAVRAAEEAGMPAGTVNVIHGPGAVLGPQLLADSRLARVAYSGTDANGRWVAQVAGSTGLPACVDRVGRGAMVVLPGAGPGRVEQAVAVMLRHAGQASAATRLIVHDTLLTELTERLRLRLESLRVGDPRLPDTDIGPLLADERRARVLGAVNHAHVHGARVLCGGRSHEAGPLYVLPTLVDRLAPGNALTWGPMEGPLVTLQGAADAAAALALANDNPGMVCAAVFGEPDAARRSARALQAGQVWINDFGPRDWASPWGGAGRCGQGRTGGRWGFDFFCDVQAVYEADPAVSAELEHSA